VTRTEASVVTDETVKRSESYRFGDCLVDADRREIARAGAPITVQPKAFELLLYLIRNRHRAVDKDELQDALWPRSIVTETALTRCVMKARRAVGDDADKQTIIKTVHGHGYRFTADIADESGSAPASAEEIVAAPAPLPGKINPQSFKLVAAAAGLFAVIIATWLFLSPPALSGPVRLAILPVENATGDTKMAWVSNGLVALMSRMLEDSGVETVSPDAVSGLVGDAPITELIAAGSDFRTKLAQTTAATHVLAARLEDSQGLYRLTYTLVGIDKRPTRRTIVGKEPTKLIRDVVDTVRTLIVQGAPTLQDHSSVSQDEFVNLAYAQAMSLYHEGRFEEAKNLFEVIIEQEPHLFWPRYERALTIRNLRDFETAERELVALRDEASKPGMEREQSAVENALGIIYLTNRRHDLARTSFLRSIELSQQIGNEMRVATGYQNLGLVEKNIDNVAEALADMRNAERIYTEADIQILPGTLLNNLSGVLMQMGQYEDAEDYSIRSIESFRLSGERRNESAAMNRLADIYTNLRNYDRATEMAENSLAVRRELDDQFGVASSLVSIADIEIRRGNFTRALQYAQQAYDIGVDIDSSTIQVPALIRIARAENSLGNLTDAAARYAMVEAIASTIDDPHNVVVARLGLAETMIASGRYDDANSMANELLDEARAEDRIRDETAALRLIAEVHSARGQSEQAIPILEEVRALAESINDSVVQATVHVLLAEAYLATGNVDAATPYVAQAAIERPEDADNLKVQARLESMRGNAVQAAELMSLARTNAGEGWSEDDAALLARYRAAADEETE
jgi:DNA-binding winged helix-turn-helix (wHTH) protein/tetratricopeptide (TPR) repeat protein